MNALQRTQLISVEEYLADELRSPVKHEYLAGVVYAMSGATHAHNRIAGNCFARLHALLRRKPCQPCNSDTKIRVRLPTHFLFYYPDVSVVCQPNPPSDTYHDQPLIIVEVMSPSTRRTDEGEKKDAYLSLLSLAVYVLVEQSTSLAIVYRRTKEGFQREVYQGLDAVIPLPELELQLPLAEIYEGVEFVPVANEPSDDSPL